MLDGLDGAFAEGGVVADDEGAVVILQGAGEDFGGGGAEAAGQDDEGAVVKDGRIGVGGGFVSPLGSLVWTTGPWVINRPVSLMASSR